MTLGANLLIIAVTCLVSYLAWQNESLMARGIFWATKVRDGQWWRFVTHGFLHADGQHLLFNMLTLYFFGSYIERLFMELHGDIGRVFYVIFYLAAIVVAMLPSFFKHRNDDRYLSLGASGAVSAVLFGFILIDPWSMILVFFVPMPAIVYAVLYVGYSMWMNKKGGDNVNHSAHLWGGAFGMLALIVMEPRIATHFVNELANLPF